MRRALLASLMAGWALSGTPSASASPSFSVTADRTSVAVGDRVIVTYSARLPKGTSLRLDALVTPAPSERLRPAGGSVLEFEPPPLAVVAKVPSSDDLEWRQSVALAPFVAGTVVVPGPHYLFEESPGRTLAVRPPPLVLTVASRLPEQKKPEELAPKADRPARIPAHPPGFWIALGLAALLLAFAVWWLLSRRKRGSAEAAAVPAMPAGAELLLALDKLAGEIRRIDSDPRAFYSDLTRAVKRYLERRLTEPVLEWTTFETVRRLRERGIEFSRDLSFSELLAAADRVKFGKGAATREDAVHHIERARRMHDELEAKLTPPREERAS